MAANPTPTTDARAWLRELLDRHEGPLLRYANRLLGDPERARDVVQDTFCRLCQQPRERVAGREAEWLFTVCRHRAVDVLRKERRMEPSEGVLATASPAPPPSEAVAAGEERSRLLALVDGLPPKQREVVRLKFQEGYSYQEISRITELSVSNVGYHLHVAIKALREQLAAAPARA